MSSDHEAEIRASVGAHQDLGSGYDEAVAEGLVERIGAEIDKRIEARLGSFGPQFGTAAGPAGVPPGGPGPAGPVPGPAGPAGAGPAAPGYQTPAGYQGYQGYLGPMLPPGYQVGPPPVRPAPIGQRNVATTITALGSMALGVGATAILSPSSNSGAQAFMIVLIWAAIAVINVAYARRR
jgi:hypothetical protein